MSENAEKTRPGTCRKAWPGLDGTWRCLKDTNEKQVDASVCDACPNFKPRHIQYPIQVKNIDVKQPYLWGTPGTPVAVRLAGDNDSKTYLGLSLGEIPWITSCSYNREKEELNIMTASNPAIYVFALNRIVYGAESWWRRLTSPDDLKDITDDDINSVWYMQLLRERFAKDAGK